MGVKSIEVHTDQLLQDSKLLENSAVSPVLSHLPTISESGMTIEKLREMIQTMNEIHKQTYELINAVALMLQQMGYKFQETDEQLAEMLSQYHGICK